MVRRAPRTGLEACGARILEPFMPPDGAIALLVRYF